MKFNYKECTAQDVANIKKLYKQQSNNPKITKKYTDILEDTKTAIKNLNSCITSQEKLRTIMKLIQQENTSFMKNIIGVNERGNNNSYYRGFLSLDEKNVLEIRIANHYETENSAKDKSNNVSQFLFQVVLKTTPPKNQTTDSITKNKKVANLNIITKTLKTNSTIEEVCSLLKCISDFLISPSDDYANNEQTTIKDTNSINNKQINCNINMKTNKKTIRLTESDLKNIIKESVKKVLSEGKVTNNIPFKRGEIDEENLQKLKDFAETVDPEFKERILNMVRSYEVQDPKGGHLHSIRAYKYSNGKPRFGRDWDTQQYIDNKKWREEKLRRERNRIDPQDLAWDEFMSQKTWR